MVSTSGSVPAVVATEISVQDSAGFASGDVTPGSAFGVEIPAIDLMINVMPSEIAQMLQNRARDGFLDPLR